MSNFHRHLRLRNENLQNFMALPNNSLQNWSEVKFYFSGDSYFQSIIERIQASVSEIRIEMYMFNFDELGHSILENLKVARLRGVIVYLLVDGIGSMSFLTELSDYCHKHDIYFNVYHPIPIKLSFLSQFSFKTLTWSNIRWFFIMFGKVNNRDHRKVILIDQKIAFIGSQNITRVHSESLSHENAWRDTGVELEGPPISQLISAHDLSWQKAKRSGLMQSLQIKDHVLKLSARHKYRLSRMRQLIKSIEYSNHRIWITTAYFLPNRKVLKALCHAAHRGVDVALCLPAKTDLLFMKWTSRLLYELLLNCGVKIYEYQDSVLHAKSFLIDHWGTVGTYNFNHRSLIHDLEIEVIIDQPQWVAKLEKQWVVDLKKSKLIKATDKRSNIFLQALAHIFYWFRYWL